MGNQSQDGQVSDKAFMANMGKVMAVLGLFFVVSLTLAVMFGGGTRDTDGNLAQIEARLAPVGTVITDPEMLLQASATAAAVEREPYTGAEVVERVCGACHNAGVLGAPKSGDNAVWSQRLNDQGLDTLVKHSIEGFNAMPPQGSGTGLSDDEIRAGVEHMLEDSGVSI